jgi:hypothetical protein
LDRVAGLVDHHVRDLGAQHVRERAIRELDAHVAEAFVPLLCELGGEQIVRFAGALCVTHQGFELERRGLRDFARGHVDLLVAERERQHDIARLARRELYLVRQVSRCQTVVVVGFERGGRCAPDQCRGDLFFAVRSEARCSAAMHRTERVHEHATVHAHAGLGRCSFEQDIVDL